MKELIEKDGLVRIIPMTEMIVTMKTKVIKLINKGKFTLMLRGSPEFPGCSFSKKAMDVLSKYPKIID